MKLRKISAVGGALLLVGGMLTACKSEGEGQPVSGDQQKIIDEIVAKFAQQDETDPSYMGDSDRVVQGDFTVAIDAPSAQMELGGKMTVQVDPDTKLAMLAMDAGVKGPQAGGAGQRQTKIDIYMNLEKEPARIYVGQDGKWQQQEISIEKLSEHMASQQSQVDVDFYLKNAENVTLEEKGDTYVLRAVPRGEAMLEKFASSSGDGKINSVDGEFVLTVDKDDYEMRSFRADLKMNAETRGEKGNMHLTFDMDSKEESVDLQVPQEALDAPEGVVFPN